jgi:hypothetical protein
VDEHLNSFPFCVDNFDVIDVLRCPNRDALFERGRFVCYGAKPEQTIESTIACNLTIRAQSNQMLQQGLKL